MVTAQWSSPILLGAVIALSAGIAAGGVGDLTYARTAPPGVSIGGPREAMVTPPKPAALGLTNPKALVTADDALVKMAFDSEDASSKVLDVARIAAPGKRDFTGAVTVKMSKRQVKRGTVTQTVYTLPPHPAELVRDGKRIPVLVSGECQTSKARSRGHFSAQAIGVADVRFGEHIRKVVIHDANSTLVLGDVFTAKAGAMSYESPDTWRIATAKGGFLADTRTSSVSLSQPMRVAGKWYTLTVRKMKVTASPLPGRLGVLTIDAPRWECWLFNKKMTLAFDDGAKPVEVPAGTYSMVFILYESADATGPGPKVYGRIEDESVTITAGKTTALSSLGKNLTVTISATIAKGKVQFSVAQRDAAGSRKIEIYGADGKRVPPPQIEVVDKAGKVIYIAKLAYG